MDHMEHMGRHCIHKIHRKHQHRLPVLPPVRRADLTAQPCGVTQSWALRATGAAAGATTGATGAGAATVLTTGAGAATVRGATTGAGTAWATGSTKPSWLTSSENPSREMGLRPRSVATRSPKAAVRGPATGPWLTTGANGAALRRIWGSASASLL